MRHLPRQGAACSDSGAPVAPADRPQLITAGSPTGDNLYTNVGATLWDWWTPIGTLNGDDQYCTTTLISPTVLLTAAHGVADVPAGTEMYVSFNGDLFSTSFRTIPVSEYHYDPLYGTAPANMQVTGHDVAVLIVSARDTRGITPAQLPTAGLLDQLAAQGGLTNATFINVGYGTGNSRTGEPQFPWDGLRRWSESSFQSLTSEWLLLNMNTSATGQGGDCYGDSGGPKFIKGMTNIVVATVTTGDYPCRSTSWDYRTDTPAARAFLSQYVTLP